MVAPGQPFQGGFGLVDDIAPSVHRFAGDALGYHAIHPQVTIASRGNGDVIERVEGGFGFKQAFECQTPFLEEAHVRSAIGHELCLKIEDHFLLALVSVPRFEGLAGDGCHAFGDVVIHGGNGAHVRLIFGQVELVGKVAFFQFGQSEGFGKGRERHLKETHGVDEANAVVFDFQQLATVADLLDDLIGVVVLGDHEVTVVPLKVVGQHEHGTRVVFRQAIQPGQKIS